MRSEVAYNKGIVKYILKGFFRHQNVGGGGGALLPQLFAPSSPAPPPMFLAVKCGERFHLVVLSIYIYTLNFAENSDLLCCKDVVMFLHSCTIYILAFLQT